MIGSELRQVAAHPAAPRSPDVGLLGEYLSGWGESTTATVIQGVHRLPAAHGLVIDENGPHRWRYWLPPFDDRARARRSRRVRGPVSRAVRRSRPVPAACRRPGRVRAQRRPRLHLDHRDGGDAREVREGTCDRRAGRSRACSRGAFVPERTSSSGRRSTLDLDWTAISNDGDGPPWAWEDTAFWSDIPLPPDGPEHMKVCRAARDRGCAVVLTGHGGDHSFDPTPFVLLDLVGGGRRLTAWRFARGFSGPGSARGGRAAAAGRYRAAPAVVGAQPARLATRARGDRSRPRRGPPRRTSGTRTAGARIPRVVGAAALRAGRGGLRRDVHGDLRPDRGARRRRVPPPVLRPAPRRVRLPDTGDRPRQPGPQPSPAAARAPRAPPARGRRPPVQGAVQRGVAADRRTPPPRLVLARRARGQERLGRSRRGACGHAPHPREDRGTQRRGTDLLPVGHGAGRVRPAGPARHRRGRPRAGQPASRLSLLAAGS